jgi:hypothetical protein
MITRSTRSAVAILLLALFPVSNFAQTRKEPKGPRAVALLEWTTQGLRLVPISLMIDGKFYDASLYRANPVPFALDEGNVYEVQRSGEPIGDFTVTSPAQIAGAAWIGEGKWVSNEERKRQEEARAKASAPPAKKAEEDDTRPVLRRSKPAEPTPPASTPPAKPDNAPEAKPAQPPAPLQETSHDPDRPVLKRGKPEVEQASKIPDEKLKMKEPPKMPAGITKTQVAVSDASSQESRPYLWKWSSAEEERNIRIQIEKLALATVEDYASKNGGPKPGKLEDVVIHALDLDYANEPDLILSARVLPAQPATRKISGKTAPQTAPPASGFEYYVTLVAREDIYATLQKTFSAVTDNKHLDAYPRMEFIDAVDADGDGAGDLLFRRITDLGSSLVIYRAYGSRLDELIRVPEPKL